MSDVVAEILSSVLVVIIGLVFLSLKRLFGNLSKTAQIRAQQIKDEGQRELVSKALERVEILAKTAVGAIESASARDLRELVKTGVEDKQKLCDLSKEALKKVKAWIEPEAMKQLDQTMDDVDDYIKSVIEKQLDKLKYDLYY